MKEAYDNYKYTLIEKSENQKLNLFIEQYKKGNKNYCRAIANSIDDSIYTKAKTNGLYVTSIKLFEKGKDFIIVKEKKSYGLSVTDKVYSYTTVTDKIIYRNGKLYYYFGNMKSVRPFLLSYFKSTHSNRTDAKMTAIAKEKLKPVLIKLGYTEAPMTIDINLNTIIANKLYTIQKLYEYYYKISCKTALVLEKYFINRSFYILNKKYIENIELLNEELLQSDARKEVLYRTINMAKQLNKTVDVSLSFEKLLDVFYNYREEVAEILTSLNDTDKIYSHLIYTRLVDELKDFIIIDSKKELTKAVMSIRHNYYVDTHNIHKISEIVNSKTAFFYYKNKEIVLILSINKEEKLIYVYNDYYSVENELLSYEQKRKLLEEIETALAKFSRRYSILIDSIISSENELENNIKLPENYLKQNAIEVPF